MESPHPRPSNQAQVPAMEKLRKNKFLKLETNGVKRKVLLKMID